MRRGGVYRDREIQPWLSLGLVAAASAAVVVAVLGFAPAAISQEDEAAVVTWEDCYACHDEAEAYATTSHGRAMARADQALFDSSCTTCHGDATEHMEDPLPENIVRWPGPDACSTCHTDSAQQMALVMPAHDRRSVECLDCHEMGHGLADDPAHGQEEDWLLHSSSYETCGDCHAAIASSFNWPFAHRKGTKPFECTDCHSAHNEQRVARLAEHGNGGLCVECHIDLAGPFVFPHPAHSVNGCVECHQPHGSTNPRMLDRRQILNTCLECHANVPSFHDLSRSRYRNCTSCHVAIHGSNRSATFFDP